MSNITIWGVVSGLPNYPASPMTPDNLAGILSELGIHPHHKEILHLPSGWNIHTVREHQSFKKRGLYAVVVDGYLYALVAGMPAEFGNASYMWRTENDAQQLRRMCRQLFTLRSGTVSVLPGKFDLDKIV